MSIIIPTFNKVAFVGETLRSALHQTYEHIEIIVVDDGSNDGTQQILLAEFNGDMTLLTQENSGVESARNAGWMASSGDLIIFLDADDLMSPDRVAAQVLTFNNDQDLVLLGTAARVIDAAGSQVGTIRPPLENESLQFVLSFSNPFVCSSVMMRRSAIEGVPFSVTSDQRVAEDYELWVRLAKKGTIRNLQPEYTSYRRLPSSRSQSVYAPLSISACKIATNQLLPLAPVDTSRDEIEDLVRCASDWGLLVDVKHKVFTLRPLFIYRKLLRSKGVVLRAASCELKLIALRHVSKIFVAQLIRMLPQAFRRQCWLTLVQLLRNRHRTT